LGNRAGLKGRKHLPEKGICGSSPLIFAMEWGAIVSDPACLLVFQNPFGFFLPEETRGCSAWGRILRVWRSDSAVKTDRPMEFNARLLVWFRAFGFLP
jgi:hypothetical protein